MVGALIALGLLALTGLTTIASGLQVWLSQQPAWAWFKTSLAGLAVAVVLVVIVLGKEFHWWEIDGELLDTLGLVWIALTGAAMGITYWLTR